MIKTMRKIVVGIKDGDKVIFLKTYTQELDDERVSRFISSLKSFVELFLKHG